MNCWEQKKSRTQSAFWICLFGGTFRTRGIRFLKPKQCQSCGAINSRDALFCQKCSTVLDVKTAIELDEKRRSSAEIITALANNPKGLRKIAEVLSELGLVEKLMEI